MLEIYIDIQIDLYSHEAVADHLEYLFIRDFMLDMGLAKIQKIGDFAVLGKSLSRRRYHDVLYILVILDNISDLLYL